eukprot:TRINITY_DN62672_c0_g1_i1.p1 TRINITY_DN62672_c0_g1~~TRINITY_DN62672_c0_g1_i1.p1  ORF type:complete len:1138 (+),score=201.41 TRINITY_DN62672_c0_g1_i1:75-3416(+)
MAQVAPSPVAQAPAGTSAEAEAIVKLRRCNIWSKIERGQLHLVTRDHVQELYEALDVDDSGQLTKEDLIQIQSVPNTFFTDEDIQELINDCGDSTGKVTVEGLYSAITQGSMCFKNCLMSLNKGPKVSKANEVPRKVLIDWMVEEHERASALWSMPQTFAMFGLFIYLVSSHLSVWTGYNMQDTLYNAVIGEGPPFLKKYVHDIPSMWDWMDTSFIGVHLKNDLVNFPYPGRLESYNQIIGGINLRKLDRRPGKCDQDDVLRKFYDQLGSACHINSEEVQDDRYILYHERNEEVLQHFEELRNERWLTLNTSYMDQHILFYNAYLGAYTNYHLTFFFEYADGKKDGTFKMLHTQETWLADPYHMKWGIIPDAIFLVILLKMLVSELLELLPACMNGPEGFISYWDVWNAIDWVSLGLCIGNIALWGIVCTETSGALQSAIAELPVEKLDMEIMINGTYFSHDALSERLDMNDYRNKLKTVLAISDEIGNHFNMLRLLVFFNSISLMLKFFKAFRANPRLNVVIKTIESSMVDLAHFLVVFFSIFLVFAIMGYVMFGYAMKPFSTLLRSSMMCWRVLMGEDMVEDMEIANVGLAWIWVFVFQFFVSIILLNMTVAIIMDAYVNVQVSSGSLEIWTQFWDAVHTIRETKGFLSLWYLIREFKDEDEPAHPGARITARSLRRAFERDRMTKANAEYLVRKTRTWMKEGEDSNDLGLTDAVKIVGQVKTLALKISHQNDLVMGMVKDIVRAPQEARFDAIMQGIDPEAVQEAGQPMAQQTGMLTSDPAKFQALTNGPAAQAMTYGGTSGAQFGNLMGQDPTTTMSANTQGTLNGGGLQQKTGNVVGRPMDESLPGAVTGAIVPIGNGTGQRTLDFRQSVTNNNSNTGAILPMDPNTKTMGQNVQQMSPQANAAMQQMMLMQMQQMQQMQASVEALQNTIKNGFQEAEYRHTWLEQRITALERRNERVEKACDELVNTFSDVDFSEVVSLPRRIADVVDMRIGKEMARFTGEGDENEPALRNTPTDVARRLDKRLDHLSAQISQILAHTEEDSDSKKMLWRIDMGVRQLRTGGGAAGSAVGAAPANPSNTPGAAPGNGPRSSVTSTQPARRASAVPRE